MKKDVLFSHATVIMNKMLLRNDNVTNNNTTQFLCVHFASFNRGMLQVKRKKTKFDGGSG